MLATSAGEVASFTSGFIHATVGCMRSRRCISSLRSWSSCRVQRAEVGCVEWTSEVRRHDGTAAGAPLAFCLPLWAL